MAANNLPTGPYQAGAADGYAGDWINPDLFGDPAYQRGLSEGRSARVDEELTVWDRERRRGAKE